jgi:hypothetical protein
MKKALWTITLALFSSLACPAQEGGKLENSAIVWQWNLSAGQWLSTLTDKVDGDVLNIHSECFQLALGNGRIIKASDCQLVGRPRAEDLATEPGSPTVERHFAGRRVTLEFTDEPDHLAATWQTDLRDGSTYLRQALTLRAVGGDVWIKRITLFQQPVPGAKTIGAVAGSPVAAGTFFLSYEHPMSENTVGDKDDVSCRLIRNAVLKEGESLKQSLVLGVAAPGQRRRGFLAYIERARAHPYRPFLHYNSWFDISWDRQKFNETQSEDAIQQFGRHLVTERGVQMDSFLFDDGWDDNKTLWQFHSGFPNGFTPLKAVAASYHAGIGVWMSPFGGYDEARDQRLRYARQFGYETNASGFSLAGPKYFDLFNSICRQMVEKYGVNQFKFDGLAAGALANQNGLTRDGDAMLRLVADLRGLEPDIYINQTTGTWPSPFWLLDVDSTWRGGADHDFRGAGSWCQKWMTYRDAETYRNVVKVAPLYPLNSLMLHGIIYAKNAVNLTNMSDADFASQAREFFGGGTQLQEMYITPRLLNDKNWDDLAEAAKWSRQNADVLVDTHWIGGDPGRGEVYGWASWAPRKGILVLRNPTGTPAVFPADVKKLFELPPGAEEKFVMRSPWKADVHRPAVVLASGRPFDLTLQPYEVVVLEETNPTLTQ